MKTYSEAEDKKVLLGDSHTTVVAGTRDVELKFTSGKTIILKEVLHSPEIKKNLVSCYFSIRLALLKLLGGFTHSYQK